jgi:hypothetical protein|tara:strand:+ start:989 stop:1375 length:387 start_codon:yes stop_codon:yes gene_type:complete
MEYNMLLDEQSFLIYAARYYDMRKSSGVEEFYDDLKKFQYLKRLFKRYEEEGELKVRLILNHLIVLYNCFGPYATHMLFFKLKEHHSCLKPFVMFLNYMPDYIEYEDKKIYNSEIPLDIQIVKELRQL